MSSNDEFINLYTYRNQLPFENISAINLISIAKSIGTDHNTTEQMYYEFVSQIAREVKHNNGVRLSFRVGSLLIKNGTIQWVQANQEGLSSTHDAKSQMSRTSRRSKMSKSLYNSSFKQQTVMTPSCHTFRDVLS